MGETARPAAACLAALLCAGGALAQDAGGASIIDRLETLEGREKAVRVVDVVASGPGVSDAWSCAPGTSLLAGNGVLCGLKTEEIKVTRASLAIITVQAHARVTAQKGGVGVPLDLKVTSGAASRSLTGRAASLGWWSRDGTEGPTPWIPLSVTQTTVLEPGAHVIYASGDLKWGSAAEVDAMLAINGATMRVTLLPLE